MKRLVLSFFILMTALQVCSVSAASLPAARLSDSSISVNFAVVPGRPLLTGNKPTFVFNEQALPGQTIHDIVAIANGSRTAPLTVTLAVGDAVTPANGGGLSFHDTGAQHGVGRWSRLGDSSVVVPPYKIEYVPITVTVPSGVKPGEYAGSISATTVVGVQFTQGRIKTTIHATKRSLIFVRVSGHASLGLKIVRAGQVIPAKHAILDVTLRNTGTVIARPATTIVTFIGAKKTYTLHPMIGIVTAGASTTLSLDVSRGLPHGTYTVTVLINYLVEPQNEGPPVQQMRTSWSGTMVV